MLHWIVSSIGMSSAVILSIVCKPTYYLYRMKLNNLTKKGVKMKKLLSMALVFTVVLSLTACGAPSYQDGTYEGEYSSDKNTTKVSITIKENKITACQAEFLDQKGNQKDENYGKDSGEANYEKAQIALEGMVQYPDKLVETGTLETLEAVSGATVSYKEFKSAVEDALLKAE